MCPGYSLSCAVCVLFVCVYACVYACFCVFVCPIYLCVCFCVCVTYFVSVLCVLYACVFIFYLSIYDLFQAAIINFHLELRYNSNLNLNLNSQHVYQTFYPRNSSVAPVERKPKVYTEENMDCEDKGFAVYFFIYKYFM